MTSTKESEEKELLRKAVEMNGYEVAGRMMLWLSATIIIGACLRLGWEIIGLFF